MSAEDQIQGFLALPTGWHYGRGRAATRFEADTALAVCAILRAGGYERLRAFPDPEDGLMLKAELGGKTVSIEVREDEDG